MKNVLFSSASEEWATPQAVYDKLNEEFHFTLDPCATKQNAKCATFFTKQQNGLLQNWEGHRVFCNPPYGKIIYQWVKKAFEESRKPNTKVVMLLPSRTDIMWFHEFIYKKAQVRFIKGRLKFGNSNNSAPFPSMIVIF